MISKCPDSHFQPENFQKLQISSDFERRSFRLVFSKLIPRYPEKHFGKLNFGKKVIQNVLNFAQIFFSCVVKTAFYVPSGQIGEQKLYIYNFFGLLAKHFGSLSKKLSAGLSKLLSTCPEDNLGKIINLSFFGLSAKTSRTFSKNFSAGLSKTHSMFLEDHFEQRKFFQSFRC